MSIPFFGKTLQSQRVLKIAARGTGVGHDKNFITGIMKIYRRLKHAQMHLNPATIICFLPLSSTTLRMVSFL